MSTSVDTDLFEARVASTYDPTTHFLQPRLPGYRQLDAEHGAMMASIKQFEISLGGLLQATRAFLVAKRENNAGAGRQVAMARSSFEEGFYHLVRAVAQPADPLEPQPLPTPEPPAQEPKP